MLPSFGIVAPTVPRDGRPLAGHARGRHLALAGRARQPVRHARTDRSRPRARPRCRTRISDVWDKGKAAVIVQERPRRTPPASRCSPPAAASSSGARVASAATRGPSSAPPRRPTGRPTSSRRTTCCRSKPCSTGSAATATRSTPTRPSPRAPASPRPILHGLCSYGIVLRDSWSRSCSTRVLDRVAAFTARFAGVVLPGESIRTPCLARGRPGARPGHHRRRRIRAGRGSGARRRRLELRPDQTTTPPLPHLSPRFPPGHALCPRRWLMVPGSHLRRPVLASEPLATQTRGGEPMRPQHFLVGATAAATALLVTAAARG